MIINLNDSLVKEFNEKVKLYFKGLTFDAIEHKYYVNNIPIAKSVSKIIDEFGEKKDWNQIALRFALKKNMTQQQVLDMWAKKNKAACDNGHIVHDFAENLTMHSTPSQPKEYAVIKYWKTLEKEFPGRYILLGVEIRMYHKILLFSGTCDFILFDRLTRTFIIGDYKTNEDLFKNYNGETLLEPFRFLLNSPYNKYQIQLSLYQILFEQMGWKVSERWVVYLQSDGNYKKYDCYDYTTHLKESVLKQAA